MEIKNEIKHIIKQFVNDENIVDALGFEEPISGLGLNSLSFMKILVAIEDKFDFSFDYNMLDMSLFESIGAISNYVTSKMEENEKSSYDRSYDSKGKSYD